MVKTMDINTIDLKALTNAQLAELTELIKKEAASRQTAFICNVEELVKNIMKDAPESRYSRYNGGWLKTVTGIDKTQENGYSIKGEFIKSVTQLLPNTLILDCSIGGSRKNQDKYYNLVKIIDADHAEFIAATDGKTWAIELWPAIEANL
jgi:hypothetical protein